MDRRKIVRILRYCIIGLVAFTVLLFTLSLHTLFIGLAGAVSGGSFDLKVDKNGPGGNWLLHFNGNPQNNGLIGTRIIIDIRILDPNGRYIAENSTSVALAPEEQKAFSLALTIPYDQVQIYNLNSTQAQAVFEMNFGIRTLGDLVGFTQTMRITAGETL